MRTWGVATSILLTLASLQPAGAEVIYVDSWAGDDTGPGTHQRPVKSLVRAVELVDAAKAPGPATIKVRPGVYDLRNTVLLAGKRSFTRGKRLVIEAEALPDEAGWSPEKMPVVLSVNPGESTGEGPTEVSGLKIEMEHVTIRGLKFLGNPVPGIWYYPIFRKGKQLDDLVVSQCLFVMDRRSMTSNVAILANGHGLVVEHCVFVGCRNPVVFWRAEGGTSRGNVMRYCIVDGAQTSAVWVCDTGDDLEFHHNLITGARYVWMRDDDNTRTYRLHDCLITDFEHYSGQCGPGWKLSPTGEGITFKESRVQTDAQVVLAGEEGIDEPLPRHYLHPVPGSDGSLLGAGLFKTGIDPAVPAPTTKGNPNGGE